MLILKLLLLPRLHVVSTATDWCLHRLTPSPNLTIFDWMSWIKPTNKDLVAITSANFGVGLGFNPFPTFDYNYLSNPGGEWCARALLISGYFPQFIHYNFFVGMTIGMLVYVQPPLRG